MKAFRDAQPHKHAMPRLLEWCDEASLAHWNQEASAVPNWKTAEERLADSGRLSKVRHPSTDQQAGRLDFRGN
jgi:hypothetical protein